jgi:hypothetical protein
LDFFALFRGYGLGMGFLLMALHHSVRFMRGERRTDLIAALIAMALAGSAMLSLLIVWYAMFARMVLVVLRGRNAALRKGRMAWCLLLGALPLLFATVFLWELQAKGQLYYGTDAGYFEGTIRSLAIFVTGAGSRPWLIAICLSVAAALLYGLWPFTAGRASARDELARLAAVLLAIDILGREFLFMVTDALFPIDRGALHLLPLSILLIACAVDRLAERSPAFALASLPLLLLPLRSVALANMDSTLLWGDNSIPGRFYALVEARQRASDRPLILAGSPVLREAWNFGALVRHSPSIALDQLDFPQPVCDLLLIDAQRFDPPPGFHTIATTSTGENSLMERMRPLQMREVLDTSVTRPATSDEFVTLWQPAAAAWRGRAAWVEVDARPITLGRSSGLELIFDIRDTGNVQIATRNVRIDQHRNAKDGVARMAVRLPRMPASMGHLTVFLYNPGKVPFRLERADVRVREILQDGDQ